MSNDSLILSTGLLKECKVNDILKWHRGHRQCVYFLSKNETINSIKTGIKISLNLFDQ